LSREKTTAHEFYSNDYGEAVTYPLISEAKFKGRWANNPGGVDISA